jgi:hypothetical protein
MRRGAKMVMVIAAAIATVFISAAPASATSNIYLYYLGNYSGYGEFQSYGDVFTVCDMRADGYGVRLYWSVPATGRTGNVTDSNGANGDCITQNVNIGEGNQVRYRLCLVNNGNVVYCTDARIDYA